MKKSLLLLTCLIMLGYAVDVEPAFIPASEIHKEVLQASIDIKAECVYTGVTNYPPWLAGRDAPWGTDVRIDDAYNDDDELISMAEDANGRIYVCYTTIIGTGRYGWGLATSINDGSTWDNRVYGFHSNSDYEIRYPEIAIADNGKIWIWGTFTNYGSSPFTNYPAFMRSSQTCYNNPDSLRGVTYFAIPDFAYPEVVTWGNGNQFVMAQYIDTGNLQIYCLYSGDSISYNGLSFAPSGGDPENASISVDVVGTDTILIHGIEYYDAVGGDWDVVCFLDTLNGSGGLYGWGTTNPNHDRYPSIFASQGYAYIAYQADMGTGNPDIMFNYSTDYGETWLGSMINLTNSGEYECYARLYGNGQTIGCVYVVVDYGQLGFNYSIDNGLVWLSTPETVDDNSSVWDNYHSAALLYTASYWHAAWEDARNSGTDGIEIYTSRRIMGQGDITHRPAELIFNYNTKRFSGPVPEKYVLNRADPPIDKRLEEVINKSSPNELIPIFVMLSKQMNSEYLINRAEQMSKTDRRQFVIQECQMLAQDDQRELLMYLRQKESEHEVSDIVSQWTTNTVCFKATSKVIREVAQRQDIWEVVYEEPLQLIGVVKADEPEYKHIDFIPEDGREVVWGVAKINADDVWSLGYTGDGVVVGHMDSGVNYNHDDLDDHMWDGGSSYPNHGWDFSSGDDDPMDTDGHGTLTAGIVAGDGTRGSQTGVAPDAQIMALRIFPGGTSVMGNAISFALTNDADLLSCSVGWEDPSDGIKNWSRGQASTIYAAGLVWCNAAGNGRSVPPYGHYTVPQDINSPADCPAPWYAPNGGQSAVMAVGATDASDNVASFSSYGPTHWSAGTGYTDYPYPPGLIKPDVAAPGTGLKSLRYDDDTGYDNTNVDGTSFAQPHLAGTIALMLERAPGLTPRQIDSIIQNHGVIDIATPGRDSLSGAGRIDALMAVNAVSQGAKWAQLRVINQASATGILQVTNITKQLSSAWIVSVSPTQFNVPINDSQAVWVTVDTTGQGMSWGVLTYHDTLLIWSNSVMDDNPEKVPIRLTTADLGTKEEYETRVPLSSIPMFSVSPNPFKSSMKIECEIPYRQNVSLAIYDVCGRKVRTLVNNSNKSGSFTIFWDGKDNNGQRLASGIYFCRIEAGNKAQTNTVVLVR